MTFVDGSVVNIVLPELPRALHTSPGQAQWVGEAYMLVLASLLLVGGALAGSVPGCRGWPGWERGSRSSALSAAIFVERKDGTRPA